MGTAIVVALALLGVGIVISQLVRMRDWLKRAPPVGEIRDSDGEDGSGNGR